MKLCVGLPDNLFKTITIYRRFEITLSFSLSLSLSHLKMIMVESHIFGRMHITTVKVHGVTDNFKRVIYIYM